MPSFSTLDQFKEHFKTTPPSSWHFGYFLLTEDNSAISSLQEVIKQFSSITPQQSAFAYNTFSGESLTLLQWQEMVETIFPYPRLFFIKRADQIKKEVAEKIVETLADPIPNTTILFIAQRAAFTEPFLKKGGVVCSLIQNKPWEKRQYYIESIQHHCAAQQVMLSPQLAASIIDRIGCDSSLLYQEMTKLLLQLGNRKKVEEGDLALLCKKNDTIWSWQNFILQHQIKESMELLHTLISQNESPLTFLSLLRSLCQKALLTLYLSTPHQSTATSLLSPVNKKQLQALAQFGQRLGKNRLYAGLKHCFLADIQLRNQTHHPLCILEKCITNTLVE